MENFIVSARKYRPQTFASVIGQSHITETLLNAISRSQLAHAYLFTGPRGVGKTTCARIFARAINCLTPTADHEACGICESCKAFAADRSFNIHELDAASNNSVDDIRALNDKVRIAPQIGKYSVYIIDEVHMLSSSAFNAFLKTLEEPPAHAIFILATTEKHKILPTILSRCQTYDFNRIRIDDTVKYLRYICEQQGVTADDESLHIIAQAADGGMRDALSTFDRVVSFCGDNLVYASVAEAVGTLDFATYFSAIDMALSGDYASLLVLLDTVLGKGFELQNFLGGLTEHVRNLLIAKNPTTLSLLEATPAMASRYGQQASQADVEFLFRAVNLLSASDSSLRTATNRRLHTELALMKLCGLNGGAPAAAIERPMLPKISGNATTATVAAAATPTPVVAAAPSPTPVVAAPTVAATPPPTPVAAPVAAAEAPAATSAPVTAPASNSATVPAPVAAPAAGRSVLGFSINAPKSDASEQTSAASNAAKAEQTQDPAQIEPILKNGIQSLAELWTSRNRPRVGLVMLSPEIAGDKITLIASNEVLYDELTEAKLDIERDILCTLSVRAHITIELREDQSTDISRPVTLEQRIQFLVDKNPALLLLRDAMDLTT